MIDPLLDKDFLIKLDQYRHKEVYAKIITLSIDGEPIAEITGNVTGGTVNINGSSAVRRTCNLTLVTNNIQVNDLDWALRTKFKL
jgi:type 1 fimbria pilin